MVASVGIISLESYANRKVEGSTPSLSVFWKAGADGAAHQFAKLRGLNSP